MPHISSIRSLKEMGVLFYYCLFWIYAWKNSTSTSRANIWTLKLQLGAVHPGLAFQDWLIETLIYFSILTPFGTLACVDRVHACHALTSTTECRSQNTEKWVKLHPLHLTIWFYCIPNEQIGDWYHMEINVSFWGNRKGYITSLVKVVYSCGRAVQEAVPWARVRSQTGS